MARQTHDARRIALVQLEAALQLYLDCVEGPDQDDADGYYPVITLAGAAEEILAGVLDSSMARVREGRREKNALEDLTRTAIAVGERLDDDGLSKEEIVARANYARNRLKHWPPRGPMTFDAKEEATDLLDRAVENYYKLTSDLTDPMRRFQAMHVEDNVQMRKVGRNLAGCQRGLRDST